MEKNASEIKYLNELYNEYYERFLRFAKSYVCGYEIAEDIVLESILYYWEHRSELTHKSNAPVYIFTVIKHKCLNYLRHLQTKRQAEEYFLQLDAWELNLKISTLEACNPEKLFSDEVMQIIHKTLNSLPQQTREIFIRSRFHNQSHKKIASSMMISTKSVEYHITKALKVLRTALKDYFPFLLLIIDFFLLRNR